jgi:Bacteriocin-protection, YdeI or OmpD-Associated
MDSTGRACRRDPARRVRTWDHVLPRSRANREAAGVRAGDAVTVALVSGQEPRTVAVPGDLAAALDAAPDARAAFDGRAFSHRREWVEWVAEGRRRRHGRAACAASWSRSSGAADTVERSTWLRLGFRPRPRSLRASHGQ